MLWWMTALLGGCTGWLSSLSEPSCPPIDAIFLPTQRVRADLEQPDFSPNTEGWIRRASVEEAAADDLEAIELPEQVSAEDVAAYVEYLRETADLAGQLADLHIEASAFDSAQNALRERIDSTGAELKRFCANELDNGCEFTPPLPADPDGSRDALREYVEVAARSQLQDAAAEALWRSVLAAISERVQAMDQEVERDKNIRAREAAFIERSPQGEAMLAAIVASCGSAISTGPPPPAPGSSVDPPDASYVHPPPAPDAEPPEASYVHPPPGGEPGAAPDAAAAEETP
jgi:hypothetical protein